MIGKDMFAARLPIRTINYSRAKRCNTKTTSYYSYDTTNSKSLEEIDPKIRMFHILAFIREGDLGVYSVMSKNDDDVSENCIIAFKTFEDAFRYKTLLEAEIHLPPYVQFASRFELEHMCAVGNYKCRVVDEGVLITPPTNTLKITDWERRSALMNGQWSVNDKET